MKFCNCRRILDIYSQGLLRVQNQYCREKVLRWKGQLEALTEIARSQPHAAYTVFSKGYKSKFTYFMRTIESFEDYVDPIQEAIDDLLLPTLPVRLTKQQCVCGKKYTVCHALSCEKEGFVIHDGLRNLLTSFIAGFQCHAIQNR